jgi:hypothetical protein
LFYVSFLLVIPFVLAAFAGTDFETGDAGGAPIFLAMGAGIVATAAAVGYSLGNRRGAFVGTLVTGGLWFGMAVLLLSDVNTIASFRLHAGAALITTTAICVWLVRHREPEEKPTSEAALDRLRSAKKKSLEGRWTSREQAP